MNASLSVVVLSNGSPAATLRAADAVTQRCANMKAQVIVVSHGEPDHTLSTLLRRHGADLVTAPATSTRAEMCDLAMQRAVGAIVTMRESALVGDAAWLEVFRGVVPEREFLVQSPRETVVLDSMVAGFPRQADDARVTPMADVTTPAVAPLEMAAIM